MTDDLNALAGAEGDPEPESLDRGVWFQSAVSGMHYRERGAAGDVLSVRIDGVVYAPPAATARAEAITNLGALDEEEAYSSATSTPPHTSSVAHDIIRKEMGRQDAKFDVSTDAVNISRSRLLSRIKGFRRNRNSEESVRKALMAHEAAIMAAMGNMEAE